jgi:hypothetical protein
MCITANSNVLRVHVDIVRMTPISLPAPTCAPILIWWSQSPCPCILPRRYLVAALGQYGDGSHPKKIRTGDGVLLLLQCPLVRCLLPFFAQTLDRWRCWGCVSDTRGVRVSRHFSPNDRIVANTPPATAMPVRMPNTIFTLEPGGLIGARGPWGPNAM